MAQLINSQYFIMIKSIVIVLVLALIPLSHQCHHSCSACLDQFYSSCTNCTNGQTMLKLEGYHSLLGVCSDLTTSTGANVGGVLLLISIIMSCSTFPNQEIVHFTLLIQSLSLLYLVQVFWATHTHYVLSSFTFLMVFTKIEYLYNRADGQVQLFKSQLFFKNTNIVQNASLILAVNGLLVTFMIAIPVFKIIRKKVNQERPNCLSEVTLERILTFANFIYLMLIQQTLLTFYLGLSLRKISAQSLMLVVLYFLSLLFFVANQWYSQFTFFRTRFTLLNIILTKIITPLFITFQRNQHYLLLILFIIFYGVDAILTNKNRNNNAINRLLYYKLFSLVVFVLLMANYLVEFNNNPDASKALGVISTLLLCGVVYFFVMESVIQCRDMYCVKQGEVAREREGVAEITVAEMGNEHKQTVQLDFNAIIVQQQPSFNNSNLYPIKEATQSNFNQINETQEHEASPKYSCSKMNAQTEIIETQIEIRPSLKDDFTEPQLIAQHFIAPELGETQNNEDKIVSKRKGKKRKPRS